MNKKICIIAAALSALSLLLTLCIKLKRRKRYI